MTHNEYLESDYWKLYVRPLVYQLARGVCHRCDSHTGKMQAHHKEVRSYKPCYTYRGQERFIIDPKTYKLTSVDVCLLCRECHTYVHGKSSYDPLRDYSELIDSSAS